MKKILMILTLFSLLLIISCELSMEAPKAGDVHYINVGIDYKNNGVTNIDVTDNLNGTVNDAKELFDALGAVIGKSKRKADGFLMVQEGNSPANILYPDYPSLTNVKKYLEELEATDKDLTIFTYSGHGIKETGHLVLAYTGSKYETLDPRTLLSWMDAIPGKKLVILDSCFSGMAVEGSPSSTNTVLNNSISKFFETYHSSGKYEKPDLYVLSASAHTDSYEKDFDPLGDKPHYHGIFTYALLEGLGWNHANNSPDNAGSPPAATGGNITVDSLFKYVKKNQAIPSRMKLLSNWTHYQHPLTTGGPLDLILFNL
ncbi:MAG TPA: caspase family protein [Sphaerochaeta sp.]|nr:caspase family protein [Sphaerochaeta sp.]